MLMKSAINPFDSQEAKPYRLDPEILAMTNLVTCAPVPVPILIPIPNSQSLGHVHALAEALPSDPICCAHSHVCSLLPAAAHIRIRTELYRYRYLNVHFFR